MSDNSGSGNTIAILAGIGILGVLGYYAITYVLKPGAKGGDCNDPASPCYQAMKPYLDQIKLCSQQYTQLFDQYTQDNASKNVAMNSDQRATLDQLKKCVDDNTAAAAKVAQGFIPTDQVALTISNVIAPAAIAGVLAYTYPRWGPALAETVKSLRTVQTAKLASGDLMASTAENAVVRGSIAANELPATYAGELSAEINGSLSSVDLSLTYDRLVAEQLITAEVASEAAAADAAAIEEDGAATLEDIARAYV